MEKDRFRHAQIFLNRLLHSYNIDLYIGTILHNIFLEVDEI